MEIPHHNQACDFGLAPLGIKAKFGPFATPLNYIQDTLSCILYEIPFLALPGISRFSSNHFHRSVLRIAQWPTGLLPTLMKSLLTFPRNNMFPLHQFPYFWIVTGKRVQKYFFPASAVLSESSLQLPRIWVGYIALSYRSLPCRHFNFN